MQTSNGAQWRPIYWDYGPLWQREKESGFAEEMPS